MAPSVESTSEKSKGSIAIVQDESVDVAARLAAGGAGEISPEEDLRIRYVCCRHFLNTNFFC